MHTLLSAVLLLLILLPAGPIASAPVVALSSPSIRQGGALAVTVAGSLPGAPVVRFVGRTWPLYRTGSTWRTYVGADARTAPGKYAVTVEADGRALARASVSVTRVAFAQRHLRVDPALLAPEKVEEEQRKVSAALRVLAPQQLWDGLFIPPTDAGPVSSPYGVLSIYNGTVRGFHRGTDFAVPIGTPVKAANHGIVRLADLLPLSGNAVLLDHGLGVITSYLHMSALQVRAGDQVRKGDVVGQVGDTGMTTGPHLHWGLRINGVYVDPLPWTSEGAP